MLGTSLLHGLDKPESRQGQEFGGAKAKNSRGISAKACSAKAMTWELELTKVLPKHEASISEVSLP